jgi:hypothetical protein
MKNEINSHASTSDTAPLIPFPRITSTLSSSASHRTPPSFRELITSASWTVVWRIGMSKKLDGDSA